MIRSQKPQTPGGVSGVIRWSYNGVPASSKWKGFLAGPPTGTFLHQEGRRSYPCLAMMTNHELACPRCVKGLEWEWKGYVPYYDSEYTRHFCLIAPDYYESVCEIPHLAPILISRAANDTDPVVVRYEAWRTTPIPHAKDREQKVDMIRFLVHVLWKDHALLEYVAKQTTGDLFQTDEAAAATSTAAAEPAVDPVKVLEQEEEKEKFFGEEKREKLQRAARNVFKVAPSANGNYRAPPKG